MSKLQGEVLTLPKMSGSVSASKSLSGNVGAKTINIGGKGDDGATFIPSVSADGVISWTNNQELPNPEPVNIKGAKGDKGDTGPQGPQGDKGAPGAPGTNGKDGAPGKDGANGKDGADGKNGIDGISPIVSVEDITGGHRVTITDKEGAKTFDVMDGKDGQGGGGGGSAIIDVVKLPTENIDEDSFYRVVEGNFSCNRYIMSSWYCYFVESLPPKGEVVTTDMQRIVAYYNLADEDVYGYLDSTLASGVGIPVGWYPLSALAPAFGVTWGGVITDFFADANDGTIYLLLEHVLYSYKDGWTSHKTIGRSSGGSSSEVFNHISNAAAGDCAHAEGYDTQAVGHYSHAEGFSTIARNAHSHAEGYGTRALGDSSHAEGYHATANGDQSHAEGYHTNAVGKNSHAEGCETEAYGENQHVQGRLNSPDYANKYAHIVGNGTDVDNRSNAHTLDWDGNAWYAGTVEGTAMILKSPNGMRFKITVDDDGTIKSTQIRAIEDYPDICG